MQLDQIFFPLALTLFAGLSTGIGSAIAFFAKKTNALFLSVSLGFSAGVMIYVSLIEIFSQAKESLTAALGVKEGSWVTVGAFFAGVVFIALIDRLVPTESNPHEVGKIEGMHTGNNTHNSGSVKLLRMGVFTAFAIAIHNFPEGLATFTASAKDTSLGIAIAVAIAIHNIPEGIAVSVPIYYATGSKKKAFRYSFLSGLSEPVGGLIGYLILYPFLNDVIFGVLFAAVAGIMIYISLDELLPLAKEYGRGHYAIYGLIAGMAVMAVSLLLLM